MIVLRAIGKTGTNTALGFSISKTGTNMMGSGSREKNMAREFLNFPVGKPMMVTGSMNSDADRERISGAMGNRIKGNGNTIK